MQTLTRSLSSISDYKRLYRAIYPLLKERSLYRQVTAMSAPQRLAAFETARAAVATDEAADSRFDGSRTIIPTQSLIPRIATYIRDGERPPEIITPLLLANWLKSGITTFMAQQRVTLYVISQAGTAYDTHSLAIIGNIITLSPSDLQIQDDLARTWLAHAGCTFAAGDGATLKSPYYPACLRGDHRGEQRVPSTLILDGPTSNVACFLANAIHGEANAATCCPSSRTTRYACQTCAPMGMASMDWKGLVCHLYRRACKPVSNYTFCRLTTTPKC